MSDSRKDLPSVNSNNFLSRVRETLQGYLGTNGNVMDRGVTVRDLADSGIVRVNPTFLSSGVGSPIIGAGTAVGTGGGTTTIVVSGGGGTTPEYVPDLTKPPAPTGFFVGAGLTQLQGGIAAPAYTEGHGHDRSILYGATYSGTGDLPTFSSAVELARFTGSIFGYPTTPATTWHVWVTHVSKDGRESDPTGGLHGLTATTGQDVPYIVTALSGQIGYDQLTTDFANSFDMVATTAGEAYGNASAAQGTANTATTSVNWLAGRYTVRTTVSVDGKTLVGGFSLSGTSAGTQGAEIEFGVAASRFWIGAPQTEGVTAVPSVKPFVVQTVDTVTPNGVTIPKGVYMDAAFIMNLEAAVARLGTAWIGTAMIADASIVDAKIASLNAEKITAGLLSAARIDGRELTIRNAANQILLDASGDSVPPWVVQVIGAADVGSVPLALPADAQNRARIRSLAVDNVSLKAAISASGNTIQLSTPGTEVWSVNYGAATAIAGGDYRELDHTRFIMEPNTYYSFELAPLATRATVDTTVQICMLPPSGSAGFLPDGTPFSVAEQIYVLTTQSVTATAPDPVTAITTSFRIRSGPSGGAVKFYANSTQDFYIREWSRFRALRYDNTVIPASSITRAGTVISFASQGLVTTPGFDTTGLPGAYDAIWTVSLHNSNSLYTTQVIYFSVPAVSYDAVRDRFCLETRIWSGTEILGFKTMASIIDSPMFGSSALIASGSYMTPGPHGSHFKFDAANIPPDEANRWFFNLRWSLVSPTPTSGVGTGAIVQDSTFYRTQLTTAARASMASISLADGCIGEGRADATPVFDDSFPVGTRNGPPQTTVLEFEYFLDYLGEMVGSKKRIRMVFNFA